MQDSHSNSKNIEIISQSEQSQISGIPQLKGLQQSFGQNTKRISGQYIRVQGRNQKIDQEAILAEFNKKKQDQRRILQNMPKIQNKKKIQKVSQKPSKKHDFSNIRKKWKGQIDENIEKYKEYLKQQKKTYDGKQKQFLLDFFKILLDGVFQLRDYSQTMHNDITANQKKIILPQSDIFLYLKGVVDNFDKAFRQAKFNMKIDSLRVKWEPLIKNLKDQTNFQTRRKVIRSKIKPIHVLQNNDEFLMSEEAKIRQQKRRQLILAQAAKNFDKPHQSEQQSIQEQQNAVNEYIEPIQSIASFPSVGDMDRRLSQDRQKLEEYKHSIGNQPIILIKKRINELLIGTPSYDKIMGDFVAKFGKV